MFNRPLLFVGVLAAAVIVPYVLLDENLSKTAKSQLARLTGESKGNSGLPLPWGGSEGKPVAAPASAAAPPPAVSLEEALRFDVTPPWVLARWPHVNTTAGDGKYMGLRVALVTGTEPSDVAGSLTYFFDDRHELARITLVGLTGDETRVVALAKQRFGLKPVPTLAAGLYVAGDPANPTSTLRVAHLPIVRADAVRGRAEVALDLARAYAPLPGIVRTAPEPPKTLPRDFRRW
jgi:hypothetical protein